MKLLCLPSRFVSLLAAVSVLTTSCETDIDVPTPPHTPRAAVLYLLRNEPNAEDALSGRTGGLLYVGQSQKLFGEEDKLYRSDATTVIVDAAGTTVEEFRRAPLQINGSNGPEDHGYYEPVRKLYGQPDQTYTLQAAVPGLESVESTLTMPSPTVIEGAILTIRQAEASSNSNNSSEYTSIDTRGRLTVTIQDNAATTDYYVATAQLLDAQGRALFTGRVSPDDSQEDIIEVGQFQLSRSLLDDYDVSPYADTNVNGQQFTLASDVRFNDCSGTDCSPAAYLEVTISTLTPDTYRFLQSKQRYTRNDGNPFAEPAPLHSNIRNGYGLFGGVTDVKYRIKLP